LPCGISKYNWYKRVNDYNSFSPDDFPSPGEYFNFAFKLIYSKGGAKPTGEAAKD